MGCIDHVWWSLPMSITFFFFLLKLFFVFSFIYGPLSVWCLFHRQLLLCLYKKFSRHKYLPQLFLRYNLLKLQSWTVDKHIHMGLVDNHIHMDLTYVFISITDNLSFQQIVKESLWKKLSIDYSYKKIHWEAHWIPKGLDVLS